MKPIDFSHSLEALSRLISSAGSRPIGNDLHTLAGIFKASKEKTSAATIKKIKSLSYGEDRENIESLKLIQLLKETASFASNFSSSYRKLLLNFALVLEANSNIAIDEFASAAIARLSDQRAATLATRDGVIREYVKRLDEALGHEFFASVHNQLSTDASITAAELMAITKAFAGKSPSGRARALQAIWNRHRVLMTFRAKSESRSGRSAA